MDSCSATSDESALTALFITSTNFGKSSGGSSARALLTSFCFANIALSTTLAFPRAPLPRILPTPPPASFVVLSLLPPDLSNLDANEPPPPPPPPPPPLNKKFLLSFSSSTSFSFLFVLSSLLLFNAFMSANGSEVSEARDFFEKLVSLLAWCCCCCCSPLVLLLFFCR